jgi:hypothetical protein
MGGREDFRRRLKEFDSELELFWNSKRGLWEIYRAYPDTEYHGELDGFGHLSAVVRQPFLILSVTGPCGGYQDVGEGTIDALKRLRQFERYESRRAYANAKMAEVVAGLDAHERSIDEQIDNSIDEAGSVLSCQRFDMGRTSNATV